MISPSVGYFGSTRGAETTHGDQIYTDAIIVGGVARFSLPRRLMMELNAHRTLLEENSPNATATDVNLGFVIPLSEASSWSVIGYVQLTHYERLRTSSGALTGEDSTHAEGGLGAVTRFD